jgi:geranylgeranyl pyrophosphate synthase
MVLLGSEVWRATIGALPYERRVLLLPQCLRSSEFCEAEADAYGLLCRRCGRCALGQLEQEAESLGYVVLIAEGTTVVTQLLEQGKVDAVIGVSCLEALERSFPHLAAEAIPGMAIPLNRAGCVDTEVDVDWVREIIRNRSATHWEARVDLDSLRTEVDSWFQRDELTRLMGVPATEPECVALDWLAKSGKRWRPFLAVCAYEALVGAERPVPDVMKQLAIAVECFHKASLIHDDIEDGDDVRYDEPALHVTEGLASALNIGDLLLGEGYRLIAECELSDGVRAQVLHAAVDGHRTLCLGQGQELAWRSRPTPMTADMAVDICRRKTAPAFEVALRIGALCGGGEDGMSEVLSRYSSALGIAYQIRDDLEDFRSGREFSHGDIRSLRPSTVLSLAFEHADEHCQAQLLEQFRSGGEGLVSGLRELHRLAADPGVEEKAILLFEHHRNEAIRSLCSLRNSRLKGLLRRVAGRILGHGRP